MTTIGPVRQTIKPNSHLHASLYNAPLINGRYPIAVEVSLNHAAKPGRIAFKLGGSILRTYRLGWFRRTPAWVQKVADDVMAGAS